MRIASTSEGGATSAPRRRCRTRRRRTGSVTIRVPSTSITTVAWPSQRRRVPVACRRASPTLAPIAHGRVEEWTTRADGSPAPPGPQLANLDELEAERSDTLEHAVQRGLVEVRPVQHRLGGLEGGVEAVELREDCVADPADDPKL